MRSEVRIRLADGQETSLDLEEVQPMPHDAARAWLDAEFVRLGCEPMRLSGKVLNADKILLIAGAAGAAGFADAGWSRAFARAVEAALSKPVVRIDLAAMTVNY